MGKGFKHGGGGGGSDLNFRVLAGLEQPASPRENDIWVDTDTAVTGWHFGADEPGVYDLSTRTASDAHTVMAPYQVSAGDILNFEIPASAYVTREALRILDPSNGRSYYIRNGDGTAAGSWSKGTMVGVLLSDKSMPIGSYGSGSGTALIRAWGKYYHKEGEVWFPTGASSPVSFNAVKKNGLMVYPLSAKQYIGGTWVEKTAKSYQGGAWVDWTLYLFNNGDQCVSLTGGWAEVSKPSNTTITIGDVLAVKSDSNGKTVSLSTVGAVDLTDAKTLWITSPGSDSGRYAGIVHLCTSKDISTSVASVTLGDSAGYKSGTYSIDVSSLNGSYYIFMIATAGQYGAGYADASEIWME